MCCRSFLEVCVDTLNQDGFRLQRTIQSQQWILGSIVIGDKISGQEGLLGCWRYITR